MTDPIHSALEAVVDARQAHLAALIDLDERDACQMRRANAACDAEDRAFDTLGRIMPTTDAGRRALAAFYARECEADEPFCSAGRYLRHIAASLGEAQP